MSVSGRQINLQAIAILFAPVAASIPSGWSRFVPAHGVVYGAIALALIAGLLVSALVVQKNLPSTDSVIRQRESALAHFLARPYVTTCMLMMWYLMVLTPAFSVTIPAMLTAYYGRPGSQLVTTDGWEYVGKSHPKCYRPTLVGKPSLFVGYAAICDSNAPDWPKGTKIKLFGTETRLGILVEAFAVQRGS